MKSSNLLDLLNKGIRSLMGDVNARTRIERVGGRLLLLVGSPPDAGLRGSLTLGFGT